MESMPVRLQYLMNSVSSTPHFVSFAQDVLQPPEMRILIKGDPAVSFMIAYIRKSQGQQAPRNEKRDLNILRVILESAVSTVAKEFLGLTRLTRGRPRDIGERTDTLNVSKTLRFTPRPETQL